MARWRADIRLTGTSSRRSASRALLALACLTVGGIGSYAWAKREPGPPRLSLRSGPPPAPRPREGIYLALCALPEATLAELVEHLSSALGGANPLVENIAGDTVDDVIVSRRPWLLPLLNAALTLADGAFAVAQGHAVVVPPGRGGSPSLDLWGVPDAAASETRIRHAAWPLSFGFLLRFSSADAASRVAARLRLAITRTPSSLGLVVDGAAASRQKPLALGELPSFARSARRGAPDLSAFEKTLMDALTAPGLPEIPLPWLTLGRDSLLVSPRQGALARPGDVTAELATLLGADGAGALAIGAGSARWRPVREIVGP